MSLTTYCRYDEVRAALGVNATELADTVLALPVYEMGLVRELNRLSTSLNPAFSTIARKRDTDRTDQERALFAAVSLFAVYAVASQVGVSLPNFAPRSVSDGKASLTRFSGEPFERVLERVDAYKTDYRAALVEAFGAFQGGSTQVSRMPTMAVASPRATDPVTGS